MLHQIEEESKVVSPAYAGMDPRPAKPSPARTSFPACAGMDPVLCQNSALLK